MVRLSVNVNKVATLRNARGGDRRSVRQAAEIAIAAGCHGITVHPRPDERHIRRADVRELAAWLPVELNVEGYPGDNWLRLVERVRPAQATLVPDPPDVLTSNAGWRFERTDVSWLAGVVERLRAAACRVSLFVDPDPEQVAGAARVGADRTSHAAVVARQMGKVCLVGCAALRVDEKASVITLGKRTLREGETICLDAEQGRVLDGEPQVIVERPEGLLSEVAK